MFEKQNQSATGGSTAVQAARDVVIVQGVTASEARQIALDVMRANLLEFSSIAKETALQRGEEITGKFVDKLEKEHPEGLKQATSPSFQDALFTLQKEYAKAGDKDLGDLLIDLLVDRTKQAERDFVQLVLSESLVTAPKLTNAQINTLSVIFMVRYVAMNGAPTLEELATRLAVPPLQGDFAASAAALQHLEFAGCGSLSIGSVSIANIMQANYPGLFKTGFGQDQIDALGLSHDQRMYWVMPCLNDQTRFQVAALNEHVFNRKLQAKPLAPAQEAAVKKLFEEGSMSDDEITRKFSDSGPHVKRIVDVWSSASFESFNLTSVGIAIAHANIKRYTGEFAPLSIWVN